MGVIANFPAPVEEAKLIIEDEEFQYSRGGDFLSTANYPRCVLIRDGGFIGQYEIQNINFSSCITIMGYAFSNSLSSISVSFPKCTYIAPLAFWSSPIKEGYFNNCTYIPGRAFSGCQYLTTISFPQCTYIGNNAFWGCGSLTTVSFPKCNAIDKGAFSDCTSLSSVYLMGSVVVRLEGGSSIFTNTPLVNSTYLGVYGTIYVPSSLLTQYKYSQYWGDRPLLSRLVGI